MTISDEMVEKAQKAAVASGAVLARKEHVRAALEAVAPMLISKGLIQAVQIASEGRDSGHTIDYIIALFLKRAQEIGPQ